MTCQAVILDVDGTLVDSNDHHAWAWCDTLAEFGHEVAFERVRPLIGMGGDKVLPELTGIDPESSEGKKISARRKEIFKEVYLPTIRVFPGSRELIEHMLQNGLRLVVATSGKTDEMEPLLEVAGIHDLVSERVSSSDAENSKPDADIVVAALKKTGFAGDEVLMIGDTPYDIEAAGRAGVRTIALRCGGWSDEQLRGALATFADPADLLHHYERSPLAQPAASVR